jgi:hypothetical protein
MRTRALEAVQVIAELIEVLGTDTPATFRGLREQ